MTVSSLSKLEIAQQQLETAIGLFISRRDRISAVTLAGAADGILHGLVLKAGKQPFADQVFAVTEARNGTTPAKAKLARHINDQLRINDLKHMDESSAAEITLDIDISALGAILKAITNHGKLVDKEPPYIKAMLQWTWMFYDGERIREDEPFTEPAGKDVMNWYKNRPDHIKLAEQRLAKKLKSIGK